MNIYVGNLSPEATEEDLRQAFEAFGQVETVTIIRDRDTGQSRGFGFVGMPSETEAKTAITEMNGKDLKGQTVNVEEGRPKARPSNFRSRRGSSRGRPREGGRPGGFGGSRGSPRGGPRGGGPRGRGGPRHGPGERGGRDIGRPRY